MNEIYSVVALNLKLLTINFKTQKQVASALNKFCV